MVRCQCLFCWYWSCLNNRIACCFVYNWDPIILNVIHYFSRLELFVVI
jgi:hypothetical protein